MAIDRSPFRAAKVIGEEAVTQPLDERALAAAVREFRKGDGLGIPARMSSAIQAYLAALASRPVEADIAMLRHQCAYNGPCSDNGDGCTCTAEELNERHLRSKAASPASPSRPVEAAPPALDERAHAAPRHHPRPSPRPPFTTPIQ